MRFHIYEFNKCVVITGYRNIIPNKVEAFLKSYRKQNTKDAEIQFFEADLIASEQHLYFAILNALQAFKNRTNISKSIAMETMLYASTQHQIQKAIDFIGITPKTKNLAVIIIAEQIDQIEKLLQELSTCVGSKVDQTTLRITNEKKERIVKAFKIDNKEIETLTESKLKDAIENLIIERVALLATQI